MYLPVFMFIINLCSALVIAASGNLDRLLFCLVILILNWIWIRDTRKSIAKAKELGFRF